ncbi:MAG: hypothetical protein ACRC13_05735 [Tannerellaceae bacterium]
MYKDFIHLFILSCNKASFLIEKRFHMRLSCVEKLQLNLHLWICGSCNQYHTDAAIIDKTIRDIAKCDHVEAKTTFTVEELSAAQFRMKKQINEHNK